MFGLNRIIGSLCLRICAEVINWMRRLKVIEVLLAYALECKAWLWIKWKLENSFMSLGVVAYGLQD